MTFAELIVAPKSFIRSLFDSVRRIFNFAEERRNRAVRFFKVLAAYKDGVPVDSIASRYECSRGTVQRYARIAGLAKRSKARANQADVITDYKAEIPIKVIAKKHGISQGRVSTIAGKAGILRKKK